MIDAFFLIQRESSSTWRILLVTAPFYFRKLTKKKKLVSSLQKFVLVLFDYFYWTQLMYALDSYTAFAILLYG